MKYIITIIISYLLGSLNAAYFLSKANGFDIRDRGSGNAGASNVKVNFGWGAAVFTGLCDMFKAIIAMKLSQYLFPGDEVIPFLAGAVSILGHMYPFYMGFHGGKGFASYIGMLAALDWKFTAVMAVVIIVIGLISNYIAVPTFVTLIAAPIYFFYTGANTTGVIILAAISAWIFWKHRINIKRLLNHEEMGIREKKK